MRALLFRAGKYRINNMQCPHCGGQMNQGFTRCVNCGGEVEYESDEDIVSDFFKGIAWIVVLGGVGLILLACVMGALNNL